MIIIISHFKSCDNNIDCIIIIQDTNFQALCNMYDLYRDFTTALSSSIQLNDPLHNRYSAAQYVAWEAMQSACQLVSTSNNNNNDGTDIYINNLC